MSEANNSRGQQFKDLNWPTVILLLLSGGANFLVTDHGNRELSYEQQEALGKIRELHAAIDDFEQRQKHTLENQTAMMRNDAELLKETHAIVKRLEEFRHYDQMRGAPP